MTPLREVIFHQTIRIRGDTDGAGGTKNQWPTQRQGVGRTGNTGFRGRVTGFWFGSGRSLMADLVLKIFAEVGHERIVAEQRVVQADQKNNSGRNHTFGNSPFW